MPRVIEWSSVIVVVDPDDGQEARRPRTEVVARILARQGADEIGPFVVRIAETG